MTQIHYALVKEQNVTFAVVYVKDYIVRSSTEANRTIEQLWHHFRCPIVLYGERSCEYFGRKDIVKFLSRISASRLPWKKGNI